MRARNLLIAAALFIPATLYAASATRTSGFDYDPVSGLLSKEVIEPDDSNLCLVTAYIYDDGFGNKTSATTRNCNGSTGEAAVPTGDAVIEPRTSSTGYDIQGRFATSAINALNHTEARVYDARFGTVTSLTGPNNLTTTWSYDGFGRKTLETRADGNKTEWAYLFCSGVNEGTHPCPIHGKYLVRTTPQNSTGAQNGPISKVYYDALSREIRSETQGFDGTLVFKDTEYDSLGRVARVSRPYYAGQLVFSTAFAYDFLGRVITEIQPTTSSGTLQTRTSYNGLTVSVTVSNNGSGANLAEGLTQTRTITKNSQGQVAEVTDALGNTVTYTYDGFDNLLTTNAGGVVTTLTYDLRGRKTAMADPNMGNWTYGYNALGELVRQCDPVTRALTTPGAPDCTDGPSGNATRMTYDKRGRMMQRRERDLISNWTYDACMKGVGKLCQVTADNTYARSHSYDSLGRPETVTSTIGSTYTVTTAYDSNGRVSTLTHPSGGAAKHVYNSRGYLLEVRDNGDNALIWQAQTVSASGKVIEELLGNGLTTSRTYDVLDRLVGVVASGAGGTVQNSAYTYDVIGNLTQRVDATQGNLTENFSYDRLNRLTDSSGAGLTTRAYEYSATGNITYKSDVGTYIYPAAGSAHPHGVSSITGTVNGFTNPTFIYDDNGNLTSGAGRTLTYTSFNMPLNVAQGSNSYQYTYSAEHERVHLAVTRPTGTTETVYVHPNGGGELLYEQEHGPDGVTEFRHYVTVTSGLIGVYVKKSAYQPDEGEEMRYFHRDHIGSVEVITNNSGAVIERFGYQAFGDRRFPDGTDDPNNSIFGVTTDRGFTTHEHLDELALIHMNGRVYDPLLARFMTPDALVQAPYNLQSYNRYSYGFNNPMAGTDPSGQFFWGWVIGFFIGAEVAYQLDIIPKEVARAIQGIAVAFALGPEGGLALVSGPNAAFANTLIGGFAGGVVSGGSFEAGFQGAFTAGLFYGAGFADAGWERLGAHAAAGCVSAEASGGECGAGALSAGLAQISGGVTSGWSREAQLAARTVVGGTGSVLGGGKFANGAVTGAFGYLFNECAHGGCGMGISLGYTDTPVGGGTNHALVIGTDTYSGEQYATRGGPCGLLVCGEAGAYNEAFRDRPTEVHTVQDVGVLTVSPAAVTNWMDQFASVTNANVVAYLGPTYNSNSYAFTFVDSIGFIRPTPSVWAPGWGAGKPSSRLPYLP